MAKRKIKVKLTQRIIAENLGCTEQHLSRWKLGRCGLSVETGKKWSRLLGIDFERLMVCPVRDRPKLLGLK